MVTTRPRILSVEAFMALETDLPWEVWEGELQEVPGAGGTASDVGGEIQFHLRSFVKPRQLGLVTGADGTYILNLNPLTILVPGAAFIRWERIPGGRRPDGYIPVPPDLAVEVRSPTDRPGAIAKKAALYRDAGVPLIWWADPKRRIVAAYRHGILVAELGEGNTLDGEDVLPGFTLAVSEIFA